MNLKYMILGAGGTGGILGATLTKAGKDVTFIARGSNLDAMRNNGLIIRHLWDQTEEHLEVRALSMEESCVLSLAPEVIFICVKEYSLDSVLPFIRQTAGPRTIIIPILNIYGTGARMQKELPDCTVLDGCIYVSASLEHPGVLVQHGPILRVVFGPRDPSYISPILSAIQSDLCEAVSMEFYPPISKGMLWRNFPMSPLSELLESTFMPWPEIFKRKDLPVNYLNP